MTNIQDIMDEDKKRGFLRNAAKIAKRSLGIGAVVVAIAAAGVAGGAYLNAKYSDNVKIGAYKLKSEICGECDCSDYAGTGSAESEAPTPAEQDKKDEPTAPAQYTPKPETGSVDDAVTDKATQSPQASIDQKVAPDASAEPDLFDGFDPKFYVMHLYADMLKEHNPAVIDKIKSGELNSDLIYTIIGEDTGLKKTDIDRFVNIIKEDY